jgi:hypothetical protein
VSRWESGDREPYLGGLVRWADSLGLDITLTPRAKSLSHKGDFKMFWSDIPGVEYRSLVSGACPLIIDLTIDGRPAYVRYRWGIARLAFEDGAQEYVSETLSDNEFDGAGEEKVVEFAQTTLLPRLRAEAAKNAIETGGLPVTATVAQEVVKDFLAYLRDRTSYVIVEESGYGHTCPADDTLVEWKIERWAKKFDA